MVTANFSKSLTRIVARPMYLNNGTSMITIDMLIQFQPQFKSDDIQPISLANLQGVITIDVGRRSEFWQFRATLLSDSGFDISNLWDPDTNPTANKSAYDKLIQMRLWKEEAGTVASGRPSYQVQASFDYPDGSKRRMVIQGKIQSITPLPIVYGRHMNFIDIDFQIILDDNSEQVN